MSWITSTAEPKSSGAHDRGAAATGDEAGRISGPTGLLRPRGVALVGVSGRAGNPMARPLRYLREHGYAGGIYPVNPGYAELEGLPCYPSLAEVPGPVDLVLVLVPADRAADAVRDAGAAGAGVAVVFASGFAETGAAGAAAQQELLAAGREAGVRVLGPNCQGVVHTSTGLVATFTAAADRALPRGRGVAYVGQSGAVGGSVLDLACEMGLGLTAWVSTGNQVDLDLVEVSTALLADPDVQVVMLYVEAIGDGAAYARMAGRARAAGKHVVVLRSGRSTSGRRAAASHTGAMVGEDAGFTLTSREHGVRLVDDVDELLTVAATLTAQAPASGRRVAVVTTSGGAGSLAADRLEDLDLELPELTPATQDLLRPLIPAFGAVANPVDVTAQLFSRGAQAFGEVCRIVADDPEVDVVAVLLTMVTGEAGRALAQDLVETAADLEKPLLVAWLAGQELVAEGRAVFRRAGLPVFGSVGQLARAATHLVPEPSPSPAPVTLAAPPVLDPAGWRALVGDGAALLDAIGVRRPRTVLVTSAAQARAATARLGAPAALKLHAAGLAHKTEVGGVRLGVAAEDAARVFAELVDGAARHGVPDVLGVLVQEVVPPGVELVLGATGGLGGFPPVVTAGLGGVATELSRDVVSVLAPVTPEQALSMLQRLRAWPLLAGYRGSPPRDVAAAVDALVRIARVVAEVPRLAEIEVNPLIVGLQGAGAVAVDVLVRTTDTPPPGRPAPARVG